MKKLLVTTLSLLFVIGAAVQLNAQGWLVYDASVLPSETGGGGDTLDLTNLADNSPGPGLIQEIIDDPDIAGNKLLKYLHPDGKLMYRHYFDDAYTDSAFTMIARVKGENDPIYDRVFDLQWHNGNAGTRDELRMWGADSTFELEKVDFKLKIDADLYSWHTIRIVVNGDLSTVYMDENPEPVICGVSTSSTTSKYIKVGDGSGEAIGGYMDWCILNLSGAYAPGEGPPIPEGLYVDKKEEPVEPDWLVYDASVLPSETGGGGDTLDLTNLADNSPGPGLIQEIIDDPDIAGNKLLKYLHPDGKLMYRHYFDDAYTDSAFTMIARVRGENDPIYDRVFDLQWHNGNAGTRDELRMWGADSTFELEKVDFRLKIDADLYSWHTIRIVVSGDLSTVYMDENPVPIISGVSTSSTSSKYIKIGDGSGEAIGGYMDWCILNLSGAYAPGEGPPIPEGLYVDKKEEPVIPDWLVYDASVLPSETGGGGDTLDLTNLADNSPGPGLIQEIIDDPDIAGNKLFKYLHPDGKLMYRHYFDDAYTDSAFTMIARIRGENDPIYDRVFDLQWHNGNAGTRDELRIWGADSTFELEKVDLKVKLDVDLFAWHTIRIAVNGDLSTVYMDENSDPIISGVSTSTTTSKYIKIGDGSGEAIGGYMDWCILNLSGAYAPGEGPPIPEGLYVDTGPQPVVPKWLVYDASVLPSETGGGGDTLDITSVSDNSPGAGLIEEIIDDPDIAGNKLLKYLHPDGKKMYRHYFDEAYNDSSLTMIARVKGENDPTYDRVFDLQWRNGNANSRDELRIWPADSTLELEKAGGELKADMDLYAWHTYRIVVSGDLATIYIDEYPEPAISGVSTESNSDKYIKVGNGSGDAIGGYMDWLILDISGAYAPGEGLPIPEGLFVDKRQEPVEPKWLVYDASVLPTETSSGGDTLDLSDLSQDSPGEGFVEEIIDDPDIVGNKIFKYLQPTANNTRMYRYKFDEAYTGTSFTLIARIRGENNPIYDRAFDLQWRHGNAGVRDEFRIYTALSKFKLEKAGIEDNTELNLYTWHTYRIAVYGDSSAVFIDENPVPTISGVSKESTTDRYIKIGDGASAAIGGYLDWCILDLSGAYAPGEGLPIPDCLFVDTLVTGVKSFADEKIPDSYQLGYNYPNPFNPSTKIQFQLPKSSHVKITVYSALGQLVTTLLDEDLDSGSHAVTFDAKNCASGIYFYKIESPDFVKVRKMLLLK